MQVDAEVRLDDVGQRPRWPPVRPRPHRRPGTAPPRAAEHQAVVPGRASRLPALRPGRAVRPRPAARARSAAAWPRTASAGSIRPSARSRRIRRSRPAVAWLPGQRAHPSRPARGQLLDAMPPGPTWASPRTARSRISGCRKARPLPDSISTPAWRRPRPPPRPAGPRSGRARLTSPTP